MRFLAFFDRNRNQLNHDPKPQCLHYGFSTTLKCNPKANAPVTASKPQTANRGMVPTKNAYLPLQYPTIALHTRALKREMGGWVGGGGWTVYIKRCFKLEFLVCLRERSVLGKKIGIFFTGLRIISSLAIIKKRLHFWGE